MKVTKIDAQSGIITEEDVEGVEAIIVLLPTAEERLTALEQAMLDFLGGN